MLEQLLAHLRCCCLTTFLLGRCLAVRGDTDQAAAKPHNIHLRQIPLDTSAAASAPPPPTNTIGYLRGCISPCTRPRLHQPLVKHSAKPRSILDIKSSHHVVLPFYPSTSLPFYPSTFLSFYPSTLLPLHPSTLPPFYHSIPFYPSTLLLFYHLKTKRGKGGGAHAGTGQW